VDLLDEFQAEVARVALQSARRHGFALAGGNALAVHGVIVRPTEDIDLFTNREGDLQAATGAVVAALAKAGFTVALIEDELGGLFEGFNQDMAELEVSRDDQAVRLQLVRFDRLHDPVMMDIGPVLHLDDILGSKVAALASRAEPRDYIDVAAALRGRDREHLLDLARQADPGLTDVEFADAMLRLDRLDDAVFTQLYSLSPDQVREIRATFSTWPRRPA
jgi:hypothetical protein